MLKRFAYVAVLLTAASFWHGAWAQDGPAPTAEPKEAPQVLPDIHPLFGGCGGVYFLADPGELVVEVVKRDRNTRASTTELRAILVGPDREVLQDVSIPDDGQPVGKELGPAGRATLSTTVPRKGVYAVNITVSQDRYGQNMVWGFRSNCPRYVIETARGHKDVRHEEPILLADTGQPQDVCFLPRKGAFKMDLSGLSKREPKPQVLDAAGTVLATLDVGTNGKTSHEFPADETRGDMPWRLHLPAQWATINVDGLTRWEKSDAYPDLCYWSPDPASWFPLLENRWLLTPYRRAVHTSPGREEETLYRVHNNGPQEREIQLSLEFPGEQWPARLPQDRVTLAPGQATMVPVRFTMPADGKTRLCHVRATPMDQPEFSTYSTLTVKAGEPQANRPLDMPIMLKPYQHENEQFGYLPDYPLESDVYFGAGNLPYIRTGNGFTTWRDDAWTRTELEAATTSRPDAPRGGTVSMRHTKVGFDRDGDVYVLASCAGKGTYLHSTDGGKTFAAYEVPGVTGTMDIEQFSGHNIPDGPPPFVRFRRTASDPKLRWRSLNDLELFVPEKVDGRIEVGQPIPISKLCIGLSAHSGIPSSVVSRGSKVHVAWGEATDPEAKAPGVPTFVVTYDRETAKLGEPALIGYGPPANDVHNSPSITMDSDGRLHVLVGTHGRPFQYASSLEPNDAEAGWTEPVLAGENLNQTYIGFVCGKDNTLHVVFRLWRSGEPFPQSTHATLAYQRKRPGQPWEPPRVLVTAAFSEYSVFYHRLTIDQMGRLFLSYDYWSTYWFYRNDHVGTRRALLMSPDGGDTWKLADATDLK